MKFSFVKSSLVSLIAVFGVSQTVAAQERVEAIVDGYMIMESQVKRNLGKKKDTPANHKKALEATIDDYLVQKAIKESGVKIDYNKVNQVIENIAIQNGITYGQLLDALDYQGITLNQYRQQIGHQMMMAQVRQVSIGKSIKVEKEDVRELAHKMYDEAKSKGKLETATAPQYEVRHILLKTNPILTDAKAKAQLNALRSDILAGKVSFEEAAKKNSVDYMSAADGGNLGFNFPEVYDPAFAKTIKNTKKGVISKPFKSKFGWHILEVTDTRQGDVTKEAYLQKAYKKIVNTQAQEGTKNWVKALRRVAKIEYVDNK